MEDKDRILAPSIRQDPNLAATEDVAARMQDIDLSVLLVYIIDTAPSDVLYWIAEQFDMLGYKGWLPAKTEEGRRDMLKRALEFHRYKGTVWAIIQIIALIGYDNVTVVERPVRAKYDGTYTYDGEVFYSVNERFWRLFRVYIQLDAVPVTAGDGLLVREATLAYKNARSVLQHIGWRFTGKYDGTYKYNGTLKYGGEYTAS